MNTTTTTGPESIVTSLDWSKKLRDAGFPQEGNYFSYGSVYDLDNCMLMMGKAGAHTFAAPTAEEILRRLPRTLDEWNLDCLPNPDNEKWAVSYFSAVNVEQHTHPAIQEILPCEHDTLANAAAAMYCYLAENKILPTP